jgi:hypothetical protein
MHPADEALTALRSSDILDISAQSAQTALPETSNQPLQEALSHKKKRRKRYRQLFEEIKAQEGSAVVFSSPRKIRAAQDLRLQRENEKEQLEEDRQLRAIGKEQQKARRL